MKRLISYISGGFAEQAYQEYKNIFNTNLLYVDYNELNENNLISNEELKEKYETDYYSSAIKEDPESIMNFSEWKQEILKHSDLDELSADWIEKYVKDYEEDLKIVEEDFPVIYKFYEKENDGK